MRIRMGHQLIQCLMDSAHAEPLQLIKMYPGNNEDLTGGTAEERIEQPEYVYLVKKLLENMIIDNIGVTQEHLYCPAVVLQSLPRERAKQPSK